MNNNEYVKEWWQIDTLKMQNIYSNQLISEKLMEFLFTKKENQTDKTETIKWNVETEQTGLIYYYVLIT